MFDSLESSFLEGVNTSIIFSPKHKNKTFNHKYKEIYLGGIWVLSASKSPNKKVSKLLITCPHFTRRHPQKPSFKHFILSLCLLDIHTFTVLLQHAFSLKLGWSPFSVHLYPSYASLYTRSVNAEPQFSFRILLYHPLWSAGLSSSLAFWGILLSSALFPLQYSH